MALSQEVFDALPEEAQASFQKSEDGYVTIDSLKVAGLKGKLDGAFGERDAAANQLAEYTASEAAKIEAAAEAKFKKAVEENDFETQNKIKQEKLDDALRRADAAEGKYNARLDDAAKEVEKGIIDQLAEHAIKGGKAALKRLLRDYVKVDRETGAETYLNDDGSASSLNREQFIAEQMRGNEVFKALVNGKVTTQGGGLIAGSNLNNTNLGGVPATLEACKGDRKLEAAYFNAQMQG